MYRMSFHEVRERNYENRYRNKLHKRKKNILVNALIIKALNFISKINRFVRKIFLRPNI